MPDPPTQELCLAINVQQYFEGLSLEEHDVCSALHISHYVFHGPDLADLHLVAQAHVVQAGAAGNHFHPIGFQPFQPG
jgi:hypothetical protein